MNRSRRLAIASGANAFGLLARIAEQLLLVPILLSTWSSELFGEWLMLSALPIYLSLSDLGFVTAGSNELARRAQGGMNNAVKSFFSDYISVYAAFSLVLATSFAVVALILPITGWLELETMPPNVADTAFVVLVISALVSQNSLTLHAGLRAVHSAHIGFSLIAITAILQLSAVLVIVVVFQAGPIGVAITMLFAQLIRLLAQSIILRRLGLPPKWRLFRRPTHNIWGYIAIGMEFMLFPLAQALVLQGTLILVGKLFGAVLLTAFATHRTLSRMIAQVVQLGSGPLTAEAGLLQSEAHRVELRQLVIRIARLTLWGSFLLSVIMMAVGPLFFGVWTRGAVQFSATLFFSLVLSTVLEGQWRVAAAARLGSNRHRPLAWGYLGIVLVGLTFMVIFVHEPRVITIGFILVGINAAMLIAVLVSNRSVLGLSVWEFVREAIRFPSAELRQLKQKIGRFGQS